MGEAKRRRESGNYVQGRGTDFYRGHMISKYVIQHDGAQFWRVDVDVIGLLDAKPLVRIEYPVDLCSLERLVSEAKRTIGYLIHEGAGINASTVPVDYMKHKGLDALIAKSKTGKASVCDAHWAQAKDAAKAGKCALFLYNILLIQRFTEKLRADGLLLANPSAMLESNYTMNMLWDTYAPLCCWLGDEAVARILHDSDPAVVLDRARAKGAF